MAKNAEYSLGDQYAHEIFEAFERFDSEMDFFPIDIRMWIGEKELAQLMPIKNYCSLEHSDELYTFRCEAWVILIIKRQDSLVLTVHNINNPELIIIRNIR